MICCNCENLERCLTLKELLKVSNNFDINDCKNYETSSDKAMKMVNNKELMTLIYDYFVKRSTLSDETFVEKVIKECLLAL